MRLTITRHGQTEENSKGVVQGQLPGKLTKQGIDQARSLGKSLKDRRFDYIYSSDLARCVDTTKEVTKYHTDTTLELTKDLREINFGDIQGMRASDVEWDSYEGDFLNKKPGGGESILELQDRIVSFLDKISEVHKGQSILLVTHGGPMRAVKSYFEDIPMETLFHQEIGNCEVWDLDLT